MFEEIKKQFWIRESSKTALGIANEKYLGEKKEYFPFGIKYLDDSTLGIKPTDLVVLSARTGVGKTEMALNIALHNARLGKRVLYYALEGGQNEIENRLVYKEFARSYYATYDKQVCDSVKLRYNRFLRGDYKSIFSNHYNEVKRVCEENLKNLHIVQRKPHTKFDIGIFELHLNGIHDMYDLIIVDHLNYFDRQYINQSEIEMVQSVMKTIRDMVDHFSKPVVLISHVRKGSLQYKTPLPLLDDIYGTSEVVKISDKVIILGGSTIDMYDPTRMKTYIKVAKDRDAGYLTKQIAQCVFNVAKNCYEEEYKIGKFEKDQFVVGSK